MKSYYIIVKNKEGITIDTKGILAKSGTDALDKYIQQEKPILEIGDTIEIV